MTLSAKSTVNELKRKFVLQIYLGHGPFWKNVKRSRIVQGVRAELGLPPAQLSPPSLTNDPKKFQSWMSSVRSVWELVVPLAYREAANWDDFTVACILYDPPELSLEEFARYDGLGAAKAGSAVVGHQGGKGARPTGPAIEWIDSEGHRVDAVEEFYRAVITELGRRHFETRGEDVWQAVSEIYGETDLLHRLEDKKIETHPYVVVDRYTSNADILEAAHKIRSMVGKRQGGRPPRDQFVAIKCAALYDDHNYQETKDRRVMHWSYERLVDEFNLDPSYDAREDDPMRRRKRRGRIGKSYVNLGRKLRQERKKNRGT